MIFFRKFLKIIEINFDCLFVQNFQNFEIIFYYYNKIFLKTR